METKQTSAKNYTTHPQYAKKMRSEANSEHKLPQNWGLLYAFHVLTLWLGFGIYRLKMSHIFLKSKKQDLRFDFPVMVLCVTDPDGMLTSEPRERCNPHTALFVQGKETLLPNK